VIGWSSTSPSVLKELGQRSPSTRFKIQIEFEALLGVVKTNFPNS